ncbi:hypothetical protein [Candidatus Vondammii sp. HM_W22]|uniref:hypothetical protein n=1 Tax=Candidatus Vondammii sp. HM_W22 TaxID=2687299 RepID=UPI002E7B943B|nr:hypothetical protein [Candidatus Vondammii sp. HM_W22]
MLHGPVGFNILLGAFVITPCLRAVPGFDLPIFFSCITLLGTGTIAASTTCPLRALKPAALIWINSSEETALRDASGKFER